MTVDRQLDELGPGDPAGEISPSVDVDPAVSRVVQNERRHPDRRQHVPDVDLDVHALQGLDRARAPALADHASKRLNLSVASCRHAGAGDLLRVGRPLARCAHLLDHP